MVVISDLHTKRVQPYYDSVISFLNWLYEKYPDEEIVQLGDIFDSSSVHHSVMHTIVGVLKKFKRFHILGGNHDVSRRSGLITEPLKHHDNIFVYDSYKEVEIEGHKCLMLPWVHNAKEIYEKIEWSGNYMFAHITNIEDQFGNEGVDTSKIKACQMFGHIHTSRYINDDKIVLGIQIPTRHGELSNNFIRISKDNKKEFVTPPVYFEYQTLNYGEFPENKNNILNVINAPSVPAVWEKYKDYFIRRDGIQVLRTENESELKDVVFESGNIIDKFNRYATEKSIPLEIVSCANQYLQEVI